MLKKIDSPKNPKPVTFEDEFLDTRQDVSRRLQLLHQVAHFGRCRQRHANVLHSKLDSKVHRFTRLLHLDDKLDRKKMQHYSKEREVKSSRPPTSVLLRSWNSECREFHDQSFVWNPKTLSIGIGNAQNEEGRQCRVYALRFVDWGTRMYDCCR